MEQSELLKIEQSYTLTPLQKEVETILLTKKITPEQQKEIFRCMAAMADALSSRQHWAGDNYTAYLSDNAFNLIAEIKRS